MVFTCGAQREFAEQLVHVAHEWLKPMTGPLQTLDPLAARLDGFVGSMFVQMRGDGGLDWHQV